MTDDDHFPRICLETGLSCEACTEASARALAQVCQALPARSVGQLFVQIHRHSACARMHAHFARCYREASSMLEPAAPAEAAMAAVA